MSAEECGTLLCGRNNSPVDHHTQYVCQKANSFFIIYLSLILFISTHSGTAFCQISDSFSYPSQENPLFIISFMSYFSRRHVSEVDLSELLTLWKERAKSEVTQFARRQHEQVSTATKSISISASRASVFTSIFSPHYPQSCTTIPLSSKHFHSTLELPICRNH